MSRVSTYRWYEARGHARPAAYQRRWQALLLIGAVVCSLSGCYYSAVPDGGGGPETYVRSFAWLSDGASWTWKFQIPSSLYEHYRSKTQRQWCYDDGPCDWYRYVTDPNDDAYVEDLAGELVRAMEGRYNSGQLYHKVLQFTLDFVTAAIPYTKDNPQEWPKYPIETLLEVTGDCEDTSILYASLVRPLGRGVHLLVFPGHVAGAVEVHRSFIENAPYEVGYYAHEGRYYVFCETTGDPDEESGYIKIGELPPGVRDDFLAGQWFFFDVRAQVASHATAQISPPVSNRTDADWLRWTEVP